MGGAGWGFGIVSWGKPCEGPWFPSARIDAAETDERFASYGSFSHKILP